MKNKIPTALEFCNESLGFEEYGTNVPYFMIEFAKLHVERALKAAAENANAYNKPKFKGDVNPAVDLDSILNSYPLENIK